jgi:RimJ/RimL family protein N-acetyltransferase
VRLALQFLRDHTGARKAHLWIDARNTASLRVAAAVGARACESRELGSGAIRVRHQLDL